MDTQLYFLSPLLLIPLVRWPRRTISCIVCLVFTCCVLTFITSWQKALAPAFFGYVVELKVHNSKKQSIRLYHFFSMIFFRLTDSEMKYLYAVAYVRAPAWLAGFVLGYILFRIRNKKINLSKVMLRPVI